MSHDIYLRAHTVAEEDTEKLNDDKQSGVRTTDPKWSDYALVFDCESRITADQTLTFGFWRFCELREGSYAVLEECIFHDDGLKAKELELLRTFARDTPPQTTAHGSDRLRLYSRAKFVDEALGIAIQAKALIVGFNLPFDLSRIAVDWNPAEDGGWSLILSQWHNPKTGKLEPNESFPRIVINALNSKASIISSTRAPLSLRRSKGKSESKRVKLWPRGRFLDVRTLLWALRNRSFSLESACREFKTVHQKIDHTPTGKVTVEEIPYARNDVACTVDLLNAVKQEFDLHPINPSPDRMFSPASVAKSYLEELNVLHPCEKVNSATKVRIK